MNLLADPWPWWLGTIALSAVTIGFWWIEHRPFSISDTWKRVLSYREEVRARESELAFENKETFQAALLEATLAEFGDAHQEIGGTGEETNEGLDSCPMMIRPPWSINVSFLVALLLGGLLASSLAGGPQIHASLGMDFSRLVGDGWGGWGILLLGGIAVGFGSQMAGGCCIGHWLNGCARLQRGSLVATPVALGIGAVVSFLLKWGAE